jgi:DNA invertase Pin-like site-specific DNA recombinase
VAPRRACAYIRVSKEREDGISPEQQKEKAELQAKLLGLDLIRIYQDIDISGRSDKRPAFQEMIQDIKSGQYDVCMVYKLDRFCRNVKDFHHYVEILESHGCSLVSISQNIDTSTPVGRLLRNILADFAQFESEMIAERVKDNKVAAARKGRWNGGHVPYGYILRDKKFEINSDEASAVILIFDLRGKGWGFLKIAKELTASGYLPRQGTRRGRFWSEDSVKYIVSNPIYKGVLSYEDVELSNAVPAIVDPNIWDRAQAPKSIPNRAQQSPHLLTGLLYCTSCGHGAWTIVKNGRVYTDREGNRHGRVIRYMCRTKRDKGAAACSCRLLDKLTLEARVVDKIFSLADDKAIIETLEKNKAKYSAGNDNFDELERIKNELEALRATMAELFADRYDHKVITREQFSQKNAEYLEREQLLMGKMEELEKASPARVAENIELLISSAKNIKSFWDKLTEGERRLAIRQVVRQIDVYPEYVEIDIFGIKEKIAPKLSSDATLIF